MRNCIFLVIYTISMYLCLHVCKCMFYFLHFVHGNEWIMYVCMYVCMSVVRIWHVCEWLWCTLLILIIIPTSFLLITMNDSNSNNKYTKLLTKRHEHYTEQNVSVTSMINPTSPHIPSSIRHSLHEAVSRPRPQKKALPPPTTTAIESNLIVHS